MDKPGIKSGYSSETDATAAAQKVAEQIKQDGIQLVIFFGSIEYDFAVLTKSLHDELGGPPMIGCSTAGEITPEGFKDKCLTAMSISADKISKIKVGILENLSENSDKAGDLLREMGKEIGIDLNAIDPSKQLGMILPDGLSLKEESVMDSLGDAAMDLIVVGGSSGDELKFDKTYIAVDGKVYENAAALALIELKVPFEIIKRTSYAPTPIIFEITKATEEKRIVHEINGQPAALEYARVIGVEPDELNEKVFMSNPVGLVIGNDPYVRSPQMVLPDNSIAFYCKILEGSQVHLMESTDPVTDTKEIVDEVSKRLGNVSGLVIFNCILRHLECEGRNISQQVFEAFGDAEKIGFNTYGEQYFGHINQTVTILCIQ